QRALKIAGHDERAVRGEADDARRSEPELPDGRVGGEAPAPELAPRIPRLAYWPHARLRPDFLLIGKAQELAAAGEGERKDRRRVRFPGADDVPVRGIAHADSPAGGRVRRELAVRRDGQRRSPVALRAAGERPQRRAGHRVPDSEITVASERD